MKFLKKAFDPSGFLNLFRYAASIRHGDGNGNIQNHGRYGSFTKKGPGRRPLTGEIKNNLGSKGLASQHYPRGH